MLQRCDAGNGVIAQDGIAKLERSRAQYTLVVRGEDIYETRHWSRRKVQSDEDAIQRAQKSLDKIMAKAQASA